jgi:hypothetical protein
MYKYEITSPLKLRQEFRNGQFSAACVDFLLPRGWLQPTTGPARLVVLWRL